MAAKPRSGTKRDSKKKEKRTKRAPTPFNMFVQQRYKTLKESDPDYKFTEALKVPSSR